MYYNQMKNFESAWNKLTNEKEIKQKNVLCWSLFFYFAF